MKKVLWIGIALLMAVMLQYVLSHQANKEEVPKIRMIENHDKQKIHKEIKTVLEKAFLLSMMSAKKSKKLKIYLSKHLPRKIYWENGYLTTKKYMEDQIWYGEGIYERLASKGVKMKKIECKYIDDGSIDCRVLHHTFYTERYEDSYELSESSGDMGYLINFKRDTHAQWYIHEFRVYPFMTPEETSIELVKRDIAKQLEPEVIVESKEDEHDIPLATLALPFDRTKRAPKKIYRFESNR